MSDTTITPEHTEDTPNERRALLRKIAIGGASAAAGAVLLNHGTASAAAEPGALELGAAATNTSVTPTTLVHDPAAPRPTGASSLSVRGPAAIAGTAADFPAQVGGYGDADVINGVHGSTSVATGFGVVAANLTTAVPAAADPVPTALAIASTGAHVRLLAGAVTGPTPGKHLAGEVYVDKDGTLWFTVPTATAGEVRFVKLAGTPTAGSFHAINPQRAFDSRQPNYATALQGLLAPNTSRVISVADGHNASGGVILPNAVPAGATAVQINLTADGTTGPNYLAVTAGNITTSETSVLNWNGVGVQIANSITVPVDKDRQIRVYCGNQTGSTHVIVDVFGYYL
jgi:hypothetical protein